MNRQRSKHSDRQGMKSGHRKATNKLVLYSILLLAVMAVMIVLNNVSRRKGSSDTVLNKNEKTVIPGGQFVKEGELTFFSAAGDSITSIAIEIADDDIQRERGLMYRRSMRDDRGMLFIFEEEDYRSFWMKNTQISLDILYLDADKEMVSIHENTPTMSTVSIESKGPAKYVVEVVAGFCARFYIDESCTMDFRRTY